MQDITIAGSTIAPGTRQRVNLKLGLLPIEVPVHLPLEVLHGVAPGPTVWISAALHGDEINGVEILREVLEILDPAQMRGTVLAAPVVNVYGFLNGSRYLPDRRDLNRCFPGSQKGSLAARLASLVMREIVAPCDYGIDLHTASDHRSNWPQIRANLKDMHTRELAQAFNAPVVMHARNVEGTIRQAATKLGKCVLLYEGGEPHRFDDFAISVGTRGILRVLDKLGIWEDNEPQGVQSSFYAEGGTWVRANKSGVLRLTKSMGDMVKKGEVVGAIEDFLGERSQPLKATREGMIIGQVVNPMVYQGDALVHIGRIADINELNDAPHT